jgi:hypothetical protein
MTVTNLNAVFSSLKNHLYCIVFLPRVGSQVEQVNHIDTLLKPMRFNK